MGWFDFLKVDPTISDPVVSQASGITKDDEGIIHQKRTAASDRLAHNLVPIAGMALTPALWGAFAPTVEYSPIASKMLPQGTNAASRVINMGGKTQPLLGMSKSLPAVRTGTQLATRGTTALTQGTNAASRGSNLVKGLAGTAALGTAVGQGMSEPAQRNVSLGSPKNRSKLPYNKYNQSSYHRLVQLQRQFGGHLIRQKDGSYFLRNQYGSFYGNGRALNAKTGKMQNYDLWESGHFINSNSKQVGNNDVVARVTDSNYLYGYTGKSQPGANTSTNQTRINNTAGGKRIMAWQKKLGVKADGWWGKNTAAAYKAYLAKQNAPNPTVPDVRSSVQSPSLPTSMQQPTVEENVNSLAESGLYPNSQQKYRKGGMLVNKYQQGGAASDPMDQLAQVAAKFLQGDTQSGQQLAQVFSDQKVGKQLMQAVQQGVQQKDKRAIIIAQAIQALSGSRKARLGAKLNYFRKSIGECPEGEKLVYFKKGGQICKACQKMEEGGTADPIADFKKKKAAQKKPIQKQDLATRDSIAANRYNDQEVQVSRPGSYKKNAKGQVQWTPDRTKAPYNKGTKH